MCINLMLLLNLLAEDKVVFKINKNKVHTRLAARVTITNTILSKSILLSSSL